MAKLLDSVELAISLAEALEELQGSCAETPWFVEAKKHITPARNWKETVSLMADGTTIAREFNSGGAMLFT